MHQLRQFLKNKRIQIAIISLIVIQICMFRHTYDIDNINHSIVAQGILGNQYTWCGHTQVWQQFVLEALNGISTSTNWWMAWLWVIGILNLIIINSYIIKEVADRQIKIGLIAIEILFFGIKDPILNLNFTVVTCLGLTIGLFGICYSIMNKNKFSFIIQTVSFVMQLGLRPEQTLLSIPYLVLVFLAQAQAQDRKVRKTICIVGIIAVAQVIVNYALDVRLIQSIQQYSQFDKYTSLREQLCDYSIGKTDDTQLISYIYDWMLLDTDTVNIDQMQQLVDQSVKNSSLIIDNLTNALASCYYIVIVLGIAAFAVKKYCSKQASRVWYYLQLFESILIIGYFYYAGRGTEGMARVVKSCLYMSLPLLMLAAQSFKQDSQSQGKYLISIDNKIQIIQMLFVMAVCGTAGADIFNDSNVFTYPYWGYSGTPFNMIDTTDTGKYSENELNIMGMGLYDIIYAPGMQYRNRIYTADIKHIISDGGTMYGQTEFTQYLKSMNVQNPAMALLDRDETYYVYEGEPQRLVDYYSNILNIDVGYERVDDLKIPGYTLPRWRMFRK